MRLLSDEDNERIILKLKDINELVHDRSMDGKREMFLRISEIIEILKNCLRGDFK